MDFKSQIIAVFARHGYQATELARYHFYLYDAAWEYKGEYNITTLTSDKRWSGDIPKELQESIHAEICDLFFFAPQTYVKATF